jgi:TetR/AcrR family transcriptional regulator, cholesterol catabolism regulator
MKKEGQRSPAKASGTRKAGGGEDADTRRQEIVRLAGGLFKRSGYEQIGMRQIAAEAGILGGSLYHHFPSKRALFIEVHRLALSNNAEQIERAIEGITDPWERLEVACAEHLVLQVNPESLSNPLMNDNAALHSDMRKDLVKERDRFESIYKKLVNDLPLSPEVDRSLYRICLISLLNAVALWYRPGRLTLREVAAQIVLIFRGSATEATKPTRARKPSKK